MAKWEEVVTSVSRRRRWKPEDKRAMGEEAESSGMSLMEQLAKWFDDYHSSHPHKAWIMESPKEYRECSNR
ncbi:MAG: hypothetical protein GTN74_03895 [Proteobacteria bacterium]|nr:hypothetical protein [Pseudomonadota bacterium]NIS68429.1 hypothetical protein [Pseudomonadota bacterium]